jgi:hypothetical protein
MPNEWPLTALPARAQERFGCRIAYAENQFPLFRAML